MGDLSIETRLDEGVKAIQKNLYPEMTIFYERTRQEIVLNIALWSGGKIIVDSGDVSVSMLVFLEADREDRFIDVLAQVFNNLLQDLSHNIKNVDKSTWFSDIIDKEHRHYEQNKLP